MEQDLNQDDFWPPTPESSPQRVKIDADYIQKLQKLFKAIDLIMKTLVIPPDIDQASKDLLTYDLTECKKSLLSKISSVIHNMDINDEDDDDEDGARALPLRVPPHHQGPPPQPD